MLHKTQISVHLYHSHFTLSLSVERYHSQLTLRLIHSSFIHKSKNGIQFAILPFTPHPKTQFSLQLYNSHFTLPLSLQLYHSRIIATEHTSLVAGPRIQMSLISCSFIAMLEKMGILPTGNPGSAPDLRQFHFN